MTDGLPTTSGYGFLLHREVLIAVGPLPERVADLIVAYGDVTTRFQWADPPAARLDVTQVPAASASGICVPPALSAPSQIVSCTRRPQDASCACANGDDATAPNAVPPSSLPLRCSVVAAALEKLLTASAVLDLIERWASLRDVDPVCQCVRQALVTGVDPTGLVVHCVWHTWEDRERHDRMFQAHVETTLRRAFVPFPSARQPVTTVAQLCAAVAALNKEIGDGKRHKTSLVYDDD